MARQECSDNLIKKKLRAVQVLEMKCNNEEEVAAPVGA
jgi:hypothetical protein